MTALAHVRFDRQASSGLLQPSTFDHNDRPVLALLTAFGDLL